MKNILKKIIKKKHKGKLFHELFFLMIFLVSFPNLTFAAECAGNPVGAICLKQDKCTNGIVDSSLYSDCAGDEICCKPTASSAGSATVNQTTSTATSGSFQYTLLESLPGFFQAGTVMTDFPALILAIYKFGIWIIGICALFMITIGGVMYLGSAGNTAAATSAKGIIFDALIGVFAAMVAYLFLYVINLDLTTININFTAVNIDNTEGTPMGPLGGGAGGSGSCQALSSGDCSVSNLTTAFGSAASQASSICNGESGGSSIPSTVDKCADGNPASWGLFQINITVHSVGGYPCPSAFSGGGYTAQNHSCRVIDQTLYNNCVNAVKNPINNIAAAKSIYGKAGNSWRPWGANKRSNCNFP